MLANGSMNETLCFIKCFQTHYFISIIIFINDEITVFLSLLNSTEKDITFTVSIVQHRITVLDLNQGNLLCFLLHFSMLANQQNSPLSRQLSQINPPPPFPTPHPRNTHLSHESTQNWQKEKETTKQSMIEAFFQLHVTTVWLSLLRDDREKCFSRRRKKGSKAKWVDLHRSEEWSLPLFDVVRLVTHCLVQSVYSENSLDLMVETLSNRRCSHPFSQTAPKWHGGGRNWGRDVNVGRKRNYKKSADVKEKIKKPLEYDAAALHRSLPSLAFNEMSF